MKETCQQPEGNEEQKPLPKQRIKKVKTNWEVFVDMTTLDVNNTISSVEQVGWMDPDLDKPAAFKHTLHLLDSF